MKNKARKTRFRKKLPFVNVDSAGVDIGGSFHFVAVPPDRDEKPVRKFGCFTRDLNELADWLEECKIKTVAMESTSVYWLPLYEILEKRGFEVLLVNARHVKNVPGRKSDVLDCQWLQQLHTFGLLRGSFRPVQPICELRSFMRQRESLIQYASSHIQHIQKALTQMNLQLSNVVDNVVGVTGLKIIRAIVAGERSAKELAKNRDRRCKQSEETIAKSLEGNYRNEHLFELKQALDLYDIYQNKILECDKEIEKVIQSISPLTDSSDFVFLKKEKRKPRKHRNGLAFDPRAHLKQLTGIDLTRINGLDSHSILRLIGEIGLDMSKWPTAKHFGAWLCLAPGSKISGGKVLNSKTMPSNNRAATILRIGASTLHHSDSALGAFLRRQKKRLGAPKAITATAYKIARIFYCMLKFKKEFDDLGQDYYEEQYKERVIHNMKRKAEKLGFQIIPKDINFKVA